MNYDGNIEIMSNHDHQQKLRTAVLSIFPLHKTLFLTKVFFFEDIPQCFNFQGLFKDMIPFHGLFKASVSLANGNCKLRAEFASPMAKSTNPRLSDRAFFAHCTPLVS